MPASPLAKPLTGRNMYSMHSMSSRHSTTTTVSRGRPKHGHVLGCRLSKTKLKQRHSAHSSWQSKSRKKPLQLRKKALLQIYKSWSSMDFSLQAQSNIQAPKHINRLPINCVLKHKQVATSATLAKTHSLE